MQTAQKTATRRHRPDLWIFVLMAVIILIGLITIYAIGPSQVRLRLGSDYPPQYYFTRQLINVAAALIVFFIASKLPLKLIQKFIIPLLAAAFLSCIVLAIAGFADLGIANCANGACRWFDLGFTSFQPSELLKLSLLIYLAIFLSNKSREGKLNNFKETLLPVAVLSLAALFFIVVLQRDLGTGISLVGIILSLLVAAGLRMRYLVITIIACAVLALAVTITVPHRRERLMTFFTGDTEQVADDETYHATHARIAIGTGGLFGVGIGNSIQSTGYLPESINDSIFAIIGETFGFIGLSALIALFVALLLRLLKAINFLHDQTARLIIAGAFGWIATHLIVNISAMIGLIPLTGITLPFLSVGGTSMMFVAAVLGLAFGLSAWTSRAPYVQSSTPKLTQRRPK